MHIYVCAQVYAIKYAAANELRISTQVKLCLVREVKTNFLHKRTFVFYIFSTIYVAYIFTLYCIYIQTLALLAIKWTNIGTKAPHHLHLPLHTYIDMFVCTYAAACTFTFVLRSRSFVVISERTHLRLQIGNLLCIFIAH